MFTPERSFNLDTNRIRMFLGKDVELRTECRKVVRHLLIELHRKTSFLYPRKPFQA